MKLLMKCRVEEIRQVAPRVRSFRLRHATRAELPPFEPGAHVTVRMANGIRRQYSLCSDPLDCSRYRIAVLLDPAGLGGSRTMHESVREGDAIYVSYPDNRFALREAARYVLVAGGIGITPLLPMAQSLAREGKMFALHYCVASTAEAAFLHELRAIVPSDRLHVHASRERGGARLDLSALMGGLDSETLLYLCGPARMLEEARADAFRLAPGQVVMEDFKGLSPEAARQGDAFEITVKSSGVVLQVPENRSALDVLMEAGHAVDHQCTAGVCGTCRVTYLAGEPVHRDAYLHPRERATQFLACVSRAKGRIVLDL